MRKIEWVLLALGLALSRAWQRAFAGRDDTTPFWQLFQVRLAGESLNYLTVAGPILGEPTKATLLRERLPVAVGLGGTLIEAGIYGLTSGLITLPGLVLFLVRVTLDPGMQRAGWLVALLLALLLLFSWMMLRRRLHVLSAPGRWGSPRPPRRRPPPPPPPPLPPPLPGGLPGPVRPRAETLRPPGGGGGAGGRGGAGHHGGDGQSH